MEDNKLKGMSRVINHRLVAFGASYVRNELTTKLSLVMDKTYARPLQFYWRITEKCNYKCAMCTCWHNVDSGDELEEGHIDNMVNQICELGIKKIGITGGEPLLRKNGVLRIVKAATAKGIWVHLGTNGSLLDESYAKELVDAGISHISFSVDGIGETHDRIRGVNDAFSRVKEAINIINRVRGERWQNPMVKLNTVVQDTNLDDLVAVHDFAEQNRALVFYQPYSPFNRDLYPDKSLKDVMRIDPIFDSIDLNKVALVIEKLIRLKRTNNSIIINTIQHLNLMKSYFARALTSLPSTCTTGYRNLEMYANGDVYLCDFLKKPVGNVKEKNLRDIWYSREYDIEREKMKHCNVPCLAGCRYYPSAIKLFSDLLRLRSG